MHRQYVLLNKAWPILSGKFLLVSWDYEPWYTVQLLVNQDASNPRSMRVGGQRSSILTICYFPDIHYKSMLCLKSVQTQQPTMDVCGRFCGTKLLWKLDWYGSVCILALS